MKLSILCALLVVFSTTLFADDPAKSPKQDRKPPTNAESDVQDLVFFGLEHPYVLRIHIQVDGKGFRNTWNSHTTKFFGELDLNNDGWLSTDEAQHIDAQNIISDKSFFEKLFSAGQAQTRKLPADAGKQDGKVTRDELAAYLRRTGSGPFMTRSNAARSGQSPSERLRSHMDFDGDNKLVQHELEQAATFLQALDVNDDEIISLNELASGRNNYATAAYGSAANSKTEFVTFWREGKLDRLIKRLQNKYGTKPKDVSSDEDAASGAARLLNRRSLGWNEEFFARYDKDSGGTLDTNELRNYLQAPVPAVEIIVRRGGKKKTESRVEVVRTETAVVPHMSIDTLGDNFIMINFGRDQLELQADAAGKSTGGSSNNFYQQQFNAADRDNNEYLEKKETQRNYYFQSTFKLMDRDGDGKLFKKEMIAWLDQQNESAHSRTVVLVTNRGHNLLDAVDADRDRQLSLRERGSIADRLLKFDRNKDKRIQSSELPRQFRLMITKGQTGIQGLPVAVASTGASSAGRARKSPRWFQKMDVNNDGDISPREFLGPRKHFTRIDADKDGLIDAAEAARFD